MSGGTPPRDTPSGSRKRVWFGAIVALLLTFAAGFALGWGFGVRSHGWPHRPFDGRHGPFDRLDLTAAQHAAVDSIFHARRAQIAAFWRGPGRQLGMILDSTGSDIRAVLDSTQRVKYDEMRRRFRNMRNNMERPGGPGGRAPGAGEFPGGMPGGMGPGGPPPDGPGPGMPNGPPPGH